MRYRAPIQIFAAVLALLPIASGAAVQPPAAVMQPIDGAIAAVNADRADRIDAYFDARAVVVDDFAPFRWEAPHAASRWLHAIDRFSKRAHVTRMHASTIAVTDVRLDREADDAYVTLELRIDALHGGVSSHQRGLWNLTLHRDANMWKIVTAVWVNGHP